MHQPEETKILKIVEVGPRDGLQNETAYVPPDSKIAFVDTLSQSEVSEIEVSGFVSPRSPFADDSIRSDCPALSRHIRQGRGECADFVVLRHSDLRCQCGGLGGCPYAPGATGNVATEALVKAFQSKGEAVGVDLSKRSQARRLLDSFLASSWLIANSFIVGCFLAFLW